MPGPKHLATGTRRSGREIALLLLGAVVTLLLLTAATAVGYLNWRFGQITRYDVTIDVPPASGEPRNYLLVGSDSRAGLDPDDPANAGFFDDEGTISTDSPLRTDTIMILRVDPDEGQAWLVSLPRDLWVTISDQGDRNRINVAFTRGREVLVDTIRDNFGIPIHHYVEVDFVGFQGLVSAIGGVPFYFSDPVRDTEVGLRVDEPGCVTLDARQALNFVRSRHLEIQDPDTGRWSEDPTADFGRISRQQEFIRKAISRAASKGLGNPATLNDLVGIGVDYVGLDPSLSARDILGLGRRFASFDAETLQTYSLPATPFRTGGGADVLDLDEREAEPILNIFRGVDPSEITPGLVEVTVLNGTGVDGFAGDVSAALEAVGFAVAEPGDTVEPATRSTLLYAPGSERAVRRVARHLTSEVEFEIDDELGPDEVVLVAGDDFTTVHDQPSPTLPELPAATSSSTTDPSDGAGSTTSTTSTTQPTTTTTEPVGYVPTADNAAAEACG